jgi:hypothetical protein
MGVCSSQAIMMPNPLQPAATLKEADTDGEDAAHASPPKPSPISVRGVGAAVHSCHGCKPVLLLLLLCAVAAVVAHFGAQHSAS